MVLNFCTQTSWKSALHLQNTHNFTRFYPVASLLGDLKSSSCYCFPPGLYFKHIHIGCSEVHGKRKNRRRQLVRPKSQTDEAATFAAHEDDISKATLVWRAIKLPIYSVALVPLKVSCSNLKESLVGAHAAQSRGGAQCPQWKIRSGTLVAALLLLGVGSMGLVWASMEAGNVRSMLLLASAITCGYMYQGGSTRVETLPITSTILVASVLVGITTSLILFCSHFHQITGDKAVGKLFALVRIGTETGSNVVKMAEISLYSLLFLLGICKALPVTSIFLCALTAPMGKFVVGFVSDNHQDKSKIFMAKYFCVRLHALFGAALAAGMVAARITTRNNIPRSMLS